MSSTTLHIILDRSTYSGRFTIFQSKEVLRLSTKMNLTEQWNLQFTMVAWYMWNKVLAHSRSQWQRKTSSRSNSPRRPLIDSCRRLVCARFDFNGLQKN
jgi:hypothetical protein